MTRLTVLQRKKLRTLRLQTRALAAYKPQEARKKMQAIDIMMRARRRKGFLISFADYRSWSVNRDWLKANLGNTKVRGWQRHLGEATRPQGGLSFPIEHYLLVDAEFLG